MHSDLLEAARFVLRSAVTLLQAQAGKVIFLTAGRKTKVLRFGGDPLLSIEKHLAARVIETREPLAITKGQRFFDRDGRQLGKTSRSYLVAPIAADRNTVIGVILLENKTITGQFNDEDRSLLVAFSTTFGRLIHSSLVDPNNRRLMVHFSSNLLTLLENLYLYKNHLENNFLLSEMMKVSKMINSTLDLQSLLESIMESAKMVLKAEASSLMLIDSKTNELYFNTIAGENERALKKIRIPMGVGIAGHVAQTRQSLIVNDAQNDPRLFRQADQTINFVTRNMIATPLLVRNKVIGVIEVINSVGRDDFSEKDLELFRSFAEQSALAIHNRELIDSLKDINKELKKKVHELSSLHEISKALISTLKEKDLFDSIVRIVSDELQAERVSILLHDAEAGNLKIVSQVGLEITTLEQEPVSIDQSLSGLAFRENRIIYTNELSQSPYAAFRNEERYLTGACIVHPLAAAGTVYGVLNISERAGGEGFSDDDVRLVSTIAVQISKGIQNFRLLDEMIQKRAYEKELEITSSIQKSILPTRKLDSPHVDLGVMSVPAKMMGGDFYDFNQFTEHDFVFSVADVSGKSLPAALFMAVTSSIIRTISQERRPPAETLYRANDLIYQDSQSGMFVTLFYTAYNSQSGELWYASAGHNEQLIFRPDSHEFEVLRSKGRPLGVIDSALHGPFGQGKTYLRPGDILVLYTDGVVEAINERKDEFGMERFKKLIESMHLSTADQIVKRIYREVKEFAGTEAQYDDFTLLVVKILG